jgi:uncharacterized protein (DUF488 family)
MTAKTNHARDAAPAGDRSIVTVGHSNRPIEHLIGLLAGARVNVVADVRTTPRSWRFPWFDAAALRRSFAEANIEYVPMGVELGGRPPEPALYHADGRVRYDRLAETSRVAHGIERLLTGLDRGLLVAILCSEEDPLHCHRRLLVGRLLVGHGVVLEHLRADGRIEVEAVVDLPRRRGEAEGAWQSWKPVGQVSGDPAVSG